MIGQRISWKLEALNFCWSVIEALEGRYSILDNYNIKATRSYSSQNFFSSQLKFYKPYLTWQQDKVRNALLNSFSWLKPQIAVLWFEKVKYTCKPTIIVPPWHCTTCSINNQWSWHIDSSLPAWIEVPYYQLQLSCWCFRKKFKVLLHNFSLF